MLTIKNNNNSEQLKKRPIGIYDSGVGGLTVLEEVRKQLPLENIVYFGDNAHFPYGEKEPEEIIEYNRIIFREFAKHKCKYVISACNTSSSLALDQIRLEFPDLPMIGLIEPGAKAAVKATKNNFIAVVATSATVKSNAYLNEIKKLANNVKVKQVACPRFVHIVEMNLVDEMNTFITVNQCVEQFLEADTIIYGCTHYPRLDEVFKLVLNKGVVRINPAEDTVKQAKIELANLDLLITEATRRARYFFIWSSGKAPKTFRDYDYQPIYLEDLAINNNQVIV